MSKQTFNLNIFQVTQSIISKLKSDWQSQTRKFCSNDKIINDISSLLVEKYSEKHRAYHNLSHINYLLKKAEMIDFEDFDSVYFAIWFHDIIYAPKKSDNEVESAKLAVKLLQQLSFPKNKITLVKQIILATQTHSAENLDQDGKIFLDLDLSILGAKPEIYQNYAQAIRMEYSHVWNFLYRRGRRKILESFLQREVIFFSAEIRQNLEKQARSNLANEIKLLS